MKVILTILFILSSCLASQAQELTGYFVRQGIYSIEDSIYSENNISGNSMTVELYRSNLSETNVIRISHKTNIGTTYHDYRVVATEVAENDTDYTIFVANDQFGGDIALKYNDEDFVLLYNYNEEIEKWTGFYGGILINKNSISFLSEKIQSE